jgi:hypothetical protein
MTRRPIRSTSERRASVVAVAAALALAPATAGAATARAPDPASATRAFGRLLHERYGTIRGYWTCPAAQVVKDRIDCLAEVHARSTWHQTGSSARLVGGRIVFGNVDDQMWTRRWSPYSRRFIIRSGVDVPGAMSVNSPAYDWGFLAEAVGRLQPGGTLRAQAYDGYATGWMRFFRFTCSNRGGLVTCANALGDAMRYRRA